MEHGAAAATDAPLGDICCTLAMVVFYLGDTAGALELLDRAAALAGESSGSIEMQRALVLHRLGDLAAPPRPTSEQSNLLERAGDLIPAARAHSNLGILLSQTGAHDRAEQHLRRAAELAEELGQGLLGAAATHNLGYPPVAAGAGDRGAGAV